jgi:hypothetical protein
MSIDAITHLYAVENALGSTYNAVVAARLLAASAIVDRLAEAGWSMDPDTWLLMSEEALFEAAGPGGWRLMRAMYNASEVSVPDLVRTEARRRLAAGGVP